MPNEVVPEFARAQDAKLGLSIESVAVLPGERRIGVAGMGHELCNSRRQFRNQCKQALAKELPALQRNPDEVNPSIAGDVTTRQPR